MLHFYGVLVRPGWRKGVFLFHRQMLRIIGYYKKMPPGFRTYQPAHSTVQYTLLKLLLFCTTNTSYFCSDLKEPLNTFLKEKPNALDWKDILGPDNANNQKMKKDKIRSFINAEIARMNKNK